MTVPRVTASRQELTQPRRLTSIRLVKFDRWQPRVSLLAGEEPQIPVITAWVEDETLRVAVNGTRVPSYWVTNRTP